DVPANVVVGLDRPRPRYLRRGLDRRVCRDRPRATGHPGGTVDPVRPGGRLPRPRLRRQQTARRPRAHREERGVPRHLIRRENADSRRGGQGDMKIVVIGGSGLIGKKVVTNLRQHGHEVVAASPSSGLNTLTGEGLAEALAGADVVVDVTNSPSFEDKAVLEFFEKSTHNILAAEAAAGVKHHVALSVVGADSIPDSGYMRAKVAQESLIKPSKV